MVTVRIELSDEQLAVIKPMVEKFTDRKFEDIVYEGELSEVMIDMMKTWYFKWY